MMPLLSILIPTYQRPGLLRLCLERTISGMDAAGVDYEIVISDGNSYEVDFNLNVDAINAVGSNRIRYTCRDSNDGHVPNWINAARNARGKYVVHLADDDALLPEGIVKHLATLEAEPNTVAIFADWLAWDDKAEREMHRYFPPGSAAVFTPADPMGLVQHLFRYQLYPEMFLCRREAFLSSICFASHQLPQSLWMYQLSRQGAIQFSMEPFYKEIRVIRDGYERGMTENMRGADQYIGDEMRNVLETLVLWASRDADKSPGPLLGQIQQAMLPRLVLEVHRACERGDFIRACELQRRLNLWTGRSDGRELAVYAAQQHANKIGLSVGTDIKELARNYAVCGEARTLTIT